MATLLGTSLLYAQKDGTYLTKDDALVNQWRFMGEPEDAAPIAGKKQFYFSPTHGEELTSVIVLKNDSKCSTKCTISKDAKFIYLAIIEACDLSLSKDEKHIKIAYSLGGVKSIRTLEINGKTTSIEEMKSILTLVIDGTTYHYQPIEAK